MTQQQPNEPVKLGRSAPDNRFRLSIEQTERVRKRLADKLGWHLDGLYILLAMIPNATRRMSTELGSYTPQDECCVFHASRVFNNAMAAFLLLERGMITEATTMVRAALEATAQAILFLRDAEAVAKWLRGRRYRPGDVRRRLGDRPNFASLYGVLSSVAHANPEARWTHSVPLPAHGRLAILYGGSYQPKSAGRLLKIIVDLSIDLHNRVLFAFCRSPHYRLLAADDRYRARCKCSA